MSIARVIVDVPARSLDRPFDYVVPEDLRHLIGVGVPVVVPFGRRRAVGYVVGLAQSSEFDELRAIDAALDGPVFGEHAPDLAVWIAEHYACPLSEALRPFLPPGSARIRKDASGEWVLADRSVGAVRERWVTVTPQADASLLRSTATRQRAVLDALADGPVTTAELRAQLGDVSGAVQRLQDLGLVFVESRRRWRVPSATLKDAPRHAELTADQSEALVAIQEADPGAGVLLDGVTGSGKTEVYLRAIEEVLARGHGAIVLVPEISLTPQTVGRFRSRFGESVAVLHSRLSAGERFDQWELARTGIASVVVGPRSALFAPVKDLGIIVIDEEHEGSYKQGSSPRYHARDVAGELARRTGAIVVLGSATPSMESRLAADEGDLCRVVLSTRATGASLPEVRVVDMGSEFKNGNRSMFSRDLADALATVEARKEKAVILLNRRGYASFLLCRECGHVPECDACSVSLTYHEAGNRLACHHCAATREVPGVCPECGSPFLRRFGAGTQRVESDLRTAFPDLPVVRMDADTTSGKGGHEARLVEFEQLESGVLLGTQMIAKGLDYPDVTLVGVLGADLGLRMPDFRSAERTYQLLAQVSGRAGRGERPGTVIIQSYAPDHPAIVAAVRHDPEPFYRHERESRRELGYPPYGSLARIVVSGAHESEVRDVAVTLGASLREVQMDATVLGPAPAPLARVRGTYRWHVLLKGPRSSELATPLNEVLARHTPVSGVSRAADVDPYDML